MPLVYCVLTDFTIDLFFLQLILRCDLIGYPVYMYVKKFRAKKYKIICIL